MNDDKIKKIARLLAIRFFNYTYFIKMAPRLSFFDPRLYIFPNHYDRFRNRLAFFLERNQLEDNLLLLNLLNKELNRIIKDVQPDFYLESFGGEFLVFLRSISYKESDYNSGEELELNRIQLFSELENIDQEAMSKRHVYSFFYESISTGYEKNEFLELWSKLYYVVGPYSAAISTYTHLISEHIKRTFVELEISRGALEVRSKRVNSKGYPFAKNEVGLLFGLLKSQGFILSDTKKDIGDAINVLIPNWVDNPRYLEKFIPKNSQVKDWDFIEKVEGLNIQNINKVEELLNDLSRQLGKIKKDFKEAEGLD